MNSEHGWHLSGAIAATRLALSVVHPEELGDLYVKSDPMPTLRRVKNAWHEVAFYALIDAESTDSATRELAADLATTAANVLEGAHDVGVFASTSDAFKDKLRKIEQYHGTATQLTDQLASHLQ